MLSNVKIYQYFVLAVLISPFVMYFSNLGVLAYSPLVFLMLVIVVVELVKSPVLRLKDWVSVFIFLPYLVWAGYYYVINPLDERYLTSHLLVIITLPFIVLSFLRIKNNDSFEYIVFIYRFLRFFLVVQLIICIGQISTYLTGFGFPVTEAYSEYFMISGTFNNANDLGAAVLLLAFIFYRLENNLSLNKKIFVWVLIIALLVFSGSRSALFLTGMLFFLTRGLSIKSIFSYIVALVMGYFLVNKFSTNADTGVFSRFLQRIESLVNILKSGISVDGSVGLRLDSYLYFMTKLGNLDFGSGEINNYSKYADGAQFDTELIFQNPHSLLVELGYWLGLPGLLFFIIAMLYLLQYSDKKIYLILVLIISTSIPSSVLGSLIFYLFIICAVFVTPSKNSFNINGNQTLCKKEL